MEQKAVIMPHKFSVPPAFNQLKCEVCSCSLLPSDAQGQQQQGYLVCRKFDCKHIMGRKPTMSPSLFEFEKKLIKDKCEKDEAKRQYTKELVVKELQQDKLIMKSVFEKNNQLSSENIHLVNIPAGRPKLKPLVKKRVDRYLEHIENMINQAALFADLSAAIEDGLGDDYEKLEIMEQRFADKPIMRTISDRLCTLCKGGCCADGGDHAYLTVVTLRRFMDDNPDLSEEDVFESYACRISTDGIDDACINQTNQGCSLPRELRSNVCNWYYCESLMAYQQDIEDKEEIGTVLAIQRSNHNWNRFDTEDGNKIVSVALVDENTTQLIKVTAVD